jgi:hypothetical protein
LRRPPRSGKGVSPSECGNKSAGYQFLSSFIV